MRSVLHDRNTRWAASWWALGLGVALGTAVGCDALFGAFVEAVPQACGGTCPQGQTCNSTTNLCETPTPTPDGGNGDGPSDPTGAKLGLLAGSLGGPGLADDTGQHARIYNPGGVAMDPAGNVYFADTTNHTIRKLVLSTGVVSLVAGTPKQAGSLDGIGRAARFFGPQGIALDDTGQILFVADTQNNKIRRIILGTGEVQTVAGTGVPGADNGAGSTATFRSPCGIAVGPLGILVADRDNHAIRRILVADSTVSTLAGTMTQGSADGSSSTSSFNSPRGIAIDTGGTIYVADFGNNVIRKIIATGATVSTLAGLAGTSGTTDALGTNARFSGPTGITAEGITSLYVTDRGSHLLRKIQLGTANVQTLAGGANSFGNTDGSAGTARFAEPTGVAFQPTYGVLIADTSNHAIRQYSLVAQAVTTVAGLAGHGGTTDGPGSTARFQNPAFVVSDGSNNLFVTDENNHTIRKVSLLTGETSTLVGTAGSPGATDTAGGAPSFRNPRGAAIDSAGNLYIADTGNHLIRKVDPKTATVTTIAGQAQTTGAGDGAGANARFSFPAGIAVDGQGNVYVADTGNSTIRRLQPNGGGYQVVTMAGSPGSNGTVDGKGSAVRFSQPQGVATDGTGTVYIADTSNCTVRMMVPTTSDVTTLAGSPTKCGFADGGPNDALFSQILSVVPDGQGNLLVADAENYVVRKLHIASGTVTTILGQAGVSGVKLGPLSARLNRVGSVLPIAAGLVIVDRNENSILVVR